MDRARLYLDLDPRGGRSEAVGSGVAWAGEEVGVPAIKGKER